MAAATLTSLPVALERCTPTHLGPMWLPCEEDSSSQVSSEFRNLRRGLSQGKAVATGAAKIDVGDVISRSQALDELASAESVEAAESRSTNSLGVTGVPAPLVRRTSSLSSLSSSLSSASYSSMLGRAVSTRQTRFAPRTW
eukprot:CAMPEP_0174721714 /NCGR_PEP_ID=MMETSP1094-20130205/36966_1 /TAXON_ID=156173 /ORGANISM="Chrysochromulina brevifilum, Strain UTEX LB 985" /LENGTH=140 /DNA_ID=CAMNT_0015922459 /DNA_START=346 /DNA_END=768 /DNA_ORIENTATION=-